MVQTARSAELCIYVAGGSSFNAIIFGSGKGIYQEMRHGFAINLLGAVIISKRLLFYYLRMNLMVPSHIKESRSLLLRVITFGNMALNCLGSFLGDSYNTQVISFYNLSEGRKHYENQKNNSTNTLAKKSTVTDWLTIDQT